jgi:hypothetical protein
VTPPVHSAALRRFAMDRSVGSATDEWRAPRRLLCERSLRSVEDRWRIFGPKPIKSGRRRPDPSRENYAWPAVLEWCAVRVSNPGPAD